ncbi:hypothetical protein NQ176_g5228 [Zarea fungicola]|uniref:Uncharacterized protein n=1 Tax=Zarea fungicola TaxID=93591 RepID=A0ACC1N9G9_9HYPO|nr:hypothetical protein NQ176_g5228 [Lecanicillium fungicola]
MSEIPPMRRALTGSCHCGSTRYVLFLQLPATSNESCPPREGEQKIQRCNCTTCHKLGHFHLKPANPFTDFMLLSPLDPFESLGDYRTSDQLLHFFFCKTCGVRCLIFYGSGETVDIDLGAAGVKGYEVGNTTRVWRAKDVPPGTYISVNGHTIDAGQDGFDMRELTEKKNVMYIDNYFEGEKKRPARWDGPHPDGSY